MINLGALRYNQEMQVKVFGCILAAIYGWPYVIDTRHELSLLSDFADYYQAEAAVSNTVFPAVCKSAVFARVLPGRATSIIVTATKLKNAELFKECIVHVVNPSTSPRYTMIEDEACKKAAERAHHKLSTVVGKVYEELLLGGDSFDWDNGLGEVLFRESEEFTKQVDG